MSELLITRLEPEILQTERFSSRNRSYFLYLFKKVSGTHLMGEGLYPLEDHSLHFVAPGRMQSFPEIRGVEGFCIVFSAEQFNRYTINKEILFRLPFFSYDLEHPVLMLEEEVFQFFYSLLEFNWDEYHQSRKGFENIILSTINIILVKCAQIAETRSVLADRSDYTSLQITEQYRTLIREHFRQQHFVQFYANSLNYTSNYLNSVVKLVTGHSASALIHEQLALEAKYLLIHTKLSMKEVASELGFSDPSYFTKFFKRMVGQPPLTWFRANK